MHLQTLRSAAGRVVVAVGLLAVHTPSADAQNLVVNGGFDQDLQGWKVGSTPGLSAAWDTFDLTGKAASGAASLTNAVDVTYLVSPLFQCVAVTGGAEYHFGAHILVPGAQFNDGRAWMELNFSAAASCQHSFLDHLASPEVGTVNEAVAVESTGVAPANAQSARVTLLLKKTVADLPFSALFDEVFVIAQGEGGEAVCVPGPTTLCIDDQPGDRRFLVSATFDTVQGGGASGQADVVPLAPLGVSNGGLITFFSPTNPELLVKILNGCPLNGHYWIFYAATTNVGFEIGVTDTQSGLLWSSTNPDETTAAPVLDTAALPCD